MPDSSGGLLCSPQDTARRLPQPASDGRIPARRRGLNGAQNLVVIALQRQAARPGLAGRLRDRNQAPWAGGAAGERASVRAGPATPL
jgi:hypothetical protein